MNSPSLSSPPQNPFIRPAFWDRQNELRVICKRLLSEPPQCCAIIGETYIGKTTLLRHLTNPQSPSVLDDLKIKDKFTFVYIDCISYIGLAKMGTYASAQFWWDLYNETKARQLNKQSTPSKPEINVGQAPIDIAFEIKSKLERLILDIQRPVIFILDNFEGVAHLPAHNSEWLRSMGQRLCTYIVASRHLLYLLYQYDPEILRNPSPLWNLFSDPIYLGLMAEDEVQGFLLQAKEKAKKLGSSWRKEDLNAIKKMSGRHPELIRIACTHLFEQRLQSSQSLKTDEYEFLEFSIYRAASPICNLLWYGLADPELEDEPRVAGYLREKETRSLSLHQKVLIDVANEREITDKKILFVLEERGLIERVSGKWRVFAEVMRQFVLEQEQAYEPVGLTILKQTAAPEATEAALTRNIVEPTGRHHQLRDVPSVQAATQSDSNIKQREAPAFTYLEGKVYEYLKTHVGEVCDRKKIKTAVWENNLPTDSALQKIIERIREKIEPDPKNPRYLIAVRGQGFMLREDSSDSSKAS